MYADVIIDISIEQLDKTFQYAVPDELADVIKVDAFKKQMKDIIEYRTMEYYRRRYVEN